MKNQKQNQKLKKASLRSIAPYIKDTTDVLAASTEMEVIICDENCYVLGDSCIDETRLQDKREDQNILSDHSIIRAAINQREKIIANNIREKNPACFSCVNADTCNIQSIIAAPIFDGDSIIGGIGLYETNEPNHPLFSEKLGVFDEFVLRISDMLASKINELESRESLESLSERLRMLIGNLDDAIIGFDEGGDVVEINPLFMEAFKLDSSKVEKGAYKSLAEVLDEIGDDDLKRFIDECRNDQSPQRANITVLGREYIATYRPVEVDGTYHGGILRLQKSADIYRQAHGLKDGSYDMSFDDLIGSGEKFTELKKSAERFAKSPSTIFIQGKSGTGKEMYARAIHKASLVSKGPFIAVNCAAIPENLLESELFGYKEGAFTGAAKGGRTGKFVLANKGTLFLDEIGEMPLNLQPKLLRAIQERKIQPLGASDYIDIDIRIIAATNQNIVEMVERGEFREDLYYRLNVIPLFIPELKERREDIPELLRHFLIRYNAMLDKSIEDFDSETKAALTSYNWPGNVRELQNVVEYAVNDCTEKYISVKNLPSRIVSRDIEASLPIQPLKNIEEHYIREALKLYGSTGAGKDAAAKALGIGRSTFYRKLSEYGIE